jgi:hypothetical protein
MVMLETLMSSVMAVFSYALVAAAVWKLFQIGTDLGEIKKLLKDMNPSPAVAATPSPLSAAAPQIPNAEPISLESAEALLRQVAAESHALEQAKPSV